MAQDIFDAIVSQAIRHGLVDGTVLYTDSTHLKANANKGKYDLAMLQKSRADCTGRISTGRSRRNAPPMARSG